MAGSRSSGEASGRTSSERAGPPVGKNRQEARMSLRCPSPHSILPHQAPAAGRGRQRKLSGGPVSQQHHRMIAKTRIVTSRPKRRHSKASRPLPMCACPVDSGLTFGWKALSLTWGNAWMRRRPTAGLRLRIRSLSPDIHPDGASAYARGKTLSGVKEDSPIARGRSHGARMAARC